jgi:hypothetical protein
MKKILEEFQNKVKFNSLTENNFSNENLFPMFHNAYSNAFVKKIADCENPIFEQGEDKYIFHIPLDDGWEVRLDFIKENDKYKLSDLDSYTLPLKKVDNLPFNDYTPLPERENIMRQEYAITRIVDYYARLKDIIGKQEALNWFKDGKGEKTGVPAWMPYFTKRKAFIAYSAWIQNRLYGEDVYITKFSEEHSELLFKNSSWLFLYKVAGHLKHMIPYDEYIELFETIWKDRALWNEYNATFSYENGDILISFTM